MMLTRLFSRTVRRYAYGIGEVVSATIFAYCSSVLFLDTRSRFGLNDPGMANATAACFIALSAGVFILTTCIKRLDVE